MIDVWKTSSWLEDPPTIHYPAFRALVCARQGPSVREEQSVAGMASRCVSPLAWRCPCNPPSSRLSPRPVRQGRRPAPAGPQSQPQLAVERPLPALPVHRQRQRPGEQVPPRRRTCVSALCPRSNAGSGICCPRGAPRTAWCDAGMVPSHEDGVPHREKGGGRE